jgi:hypothetical protein
MLDAGGIVHTKHGHRRPANRGKSHDYLAISTEVRRPQIPPRVEQGRQRAGFGVDAGNVGALEHIAVEARPSEVVDRVVAAALDGDHVVELPWQSREGVGHAAVLAPLERTLPDETPEL